LWEFFHGLLLCGISVAEESNSGVGSESEIFDPDILGNLIARIEHIASMDVWAPHFDVSILQFLVHSGVHVLTRGQKNDISHSQLPNFDC